MDAELFHAGGQTDRKTCDEANSRFSKFFERAWRAECDYCIVFSIDVLSEHSIVPGEERELCNEYWVGKYYGRKQS